MRCASEIGPNAAKADFANPYTPRGYGGGAGWLRIGRYDAPRRRALWVRFEEVEGPPWLEERSNMGAIEMCAGREGDDAYVKIEPGNPIYPDMLDVLLRAADHIPGRYDSTPTKGHGSR